MLDSSHPRRPDRGHVQITIRPDAAPDRPTTPTPSTRVASLPTAPSLGFSMRASPRNPHARSLSAASSPAAHGSAQGIARWRATIAAQVAQIQREGWRKGLFGRTRLSNPRPGGGGGVDLAFRRAFRAFAALWVAQDDAAPGGSAHLHADDDLVPPGSPAPGGRGKRIPPLSRLGQLVVLVLLALGLREVFSPSRTAPRRRGAGPVRVKGRNPFAVLAELEGGGAPSRYETHVPGVEHVWKTSGAPVDAYSDAGEEGDTTAVVLHWKRTDNVGVILAHLCQHTFFDSVFVWNNNPDVVLTPQTFAKSRCPPSKLRIYNSPRNLFFLARYLACAQSSTPHCFFQDDDWLVRPVRALYAQFRRDPEGPVVVSTNEEVAALYGLEWCFYNNPLHTCFAWVGTGAFTSRTHVDRFLLHTGATADARDELAHADNSFTTSLNEPPYVLQSALAPLPAPHGHSDGEGIARNKGYIWKGLARLSSQLNITYPPPAAPGAPLTTLVLPPPGPGPYRLPSAPPLPPHPHAHHARAPCLPRGACTFLTNVQLLPPPDAAAFPGLEAVRSLDEWEEHLGHTARGWREGGERWSAEEDWARRWSYANAVDGEVRSVFRSPDVVKTCDYLALGLLAPLDAAWTPTATLHVVLAHAEAVLAKTRVEVSPDGWRWFAPAGATAPPPKWTCARAPLAALAALAPPDAPFPDSVLLSPRGRRALAAAEAAEGSGVLGRWWARQRRRRAAGARECSVSVGAALGEEAGGGEGRGWRFVRVVVVQGEGEEDGRELAGQFERASRDQQQQPQVPARVRLSPARLVAAARSPRRPLLAPSPASPRRARAESRSACAAAPSLLSTPPGGSADPRPRVACSPRVAVTVHPPLGPPPGLWPPGGGGQQAHPLQGQQQPQGHANQQQSGASTSLLTIVRAQIVFLLSTLSEDNFVKNRDEIRSLLEHHAPAHAHLIRRLIQGAASLLTSSPASPPSASQSQPPSPDLHLRLLASEVQRCSRDPTLAERFRDAVLEGAEGPAGSDAVLRSFSLPTLLSHPSLAELSPLERLVFCVPFLTLLFPSSAPPTGLKRALGLDAARVVRQALQPALDQLGAPAATVHDLAELSPLPISRMFAILLSDLYVTDAPPAPPAADGTESQAPEQALTDDDRRALILATVRGRLGPEVGAQALAHAFNEVAFDEHRPPTAIAALARLAPVPALCSAELARAVLGKFGALEGDAGAEMRVAQQLHELLDLAQREGDAGRAGGGVDVASWLRAVHELHPALRWGDVLRAFDSPLRALPDGPLALRALGAALTLSPAPPLDPASGDARANAPHPHGLVSAPGGSSLVSGLWAPWANPSQQAALLERLAFLATAPPGADVEPALALAALPGVHRVVALEDAAQSGPTIKALAAQVQNSAWNAQELTTALVRLSGAVEGNGEVAARVHDLLDRGCKTNPELVLVALTQIEKPWNAVHAELTARLLSTFLAGHPAHQLVFLRLYQVDRQFLFAALRDFYAESEMNVTRIVDIAQDLKALDEVLAFRPFVLALDLAALASRREYLNLDKWLATQMQQHGAQLVRATLEFVGHKVQHELRRQEMDHPPEPTTLALNAATIAVFMRVLRAHHELFTGNDVELFKEVRTQCLQLHPRLMNFSPKNTDTEPGMAVTSFSPAIEAECDSLYKRMYDQEVAVDKVVGALRQAKESDNQHDHEFFACFLHGLFDEHRFFNTYPSNELALTASLFGDLIQFHLIDFVPLGIAVRYVLDALRNPPDSNWFRFGIQALARFQSRLSEWPQLAHSILSIPHVQQLHPDVANTARQALLQRENGGPAPAGNGAPGGAELGDLSAPSVAAGQDAAAAAAAAPPQEPERLAFTAIHVEDDGGDPEAPDEQTSDKILFIVNNLAPSNFDSKVADMLKRIEPLHFAWFAHYLVAQRVSIEPNNHALYQQFLEALKMPTLVKRVLYETFVKLATLLNSDKTVQSSTERTLLKNLGSWLGGLTLAKDKPIKQSNIAFKQLLIEGYDSNRLIVAIPFVCKVLEQCAKSRVFRPPNPWLMAILRLLVELYQFAELKLNLKFEIEVLCKSLDVDLKDVEPTELLRNRPKELAAQAAAAAAAAQQAQTHAQIAALAAQQPGAGAGGAGPSSVELALANLAAQQQQQAQLGAQAHDVDEHALRAGFGGPAHHALPAAGAGDAGRLPPMLGQNQPGYSLSLQDTVSAALANLPSHVVFNAQLPMFANNPALKRLVCLAIDRAIREIIAPVVERSVTIAGISTRELTMKDFAMEGDESKMATAAHLMVQNLAGSLALVTCKEPLRLSMVAHTRTLLLQNGFTDESLPEQAVLVLVAENLDVACSIVEKVAMEKAVLEVDEGLSPAYLARRAHRERSREAFWDTAAMAASHYSGMLPDPLRLKLGGLSPQQLQVYEDFARLRTVPPAPGSVDGRNGILYADSPAMAAAVAPQAAAVAVQAAQAAVESAAMTAPQAMEKFASLVGELDQALAAESASALTGVGQESDLRRIVQQIPVIAASSAARDETALACSQKVVQLLYRSETALARDAYVFLLDRLCAISPKVAKEVTMWLVYAEDERKFNVPVTVALLHARFINVAELDVQLAKFVVRDFRAPVVDFVANLLTACLAEVPPVATREQFANAFEALSQAVRQGKATDAARTLLQDVQTRGTVNVRALSPGKFQSSDEPAAREQLTFCFAEWVRLYQQSFNVEKSFVDFVVQLQKQGILKGEEISSLFFRVCAEVSIDSYIKNKAAGGTPATGIFQPVDAFARLITFMIKYHADPTGANNDKAKVHYMTKVLSIVVLVLANSHEELGPHFQQKPYYRFFSSLLANLSSIESHLGAAYHQILVALSHSLNTLQPAWFPGFTFSWVTLISSRFFMPKLLMMDEPREGYAAFLRQLVSLMRFLAPHLKRGQLSEAIRLLYVGTERVLLVLLHSFPDFLAQAAPALVDTLPSQAVHLKNLINSAFPIQTTVVLPDPLEPGLQLDKLPEAQQSPTLLTDPTAGLQAAGLRPIIDSYLQSGAPADLPQKVQERLALAGNQDADAESKLNVPLINSLVAHLTISAINSHKARHGSVAFDAEGPAARLLRELIRDADPAGRYSLLSALANALRWPNAHSNWATAAVLDVFATGSDDERESVLRVVLERATTSRPVPFGVTHSLTQLLHSHGAAVEAVLAARLPKDDPGAKVLVQHLARLAGGPPRYAAPQQPALQA